MNTVMSYSAAQQLPTPLMMSPEHMQRANEYTFSRKYVEKYIRFEIESSHEIQQKIAQTVEDIYLWLEQDYYESKQLRLQPLKSYSVEQMTELAHQIVVGCASCQEPELFTSITAKLAHRLDWDTQRAAIHTMAELLVCFARNLLISIVKVPAGGEGAQYKRESIAVLSHIPISDKLREYIANSSFLPPLVCAPRVITRNTQSGYLTFNKSVILNGRIQGQLALDVLNKQNQTALTLDLEFLLNVEELPNKPLDTVKKIVAWTAFKEQTNQMCLLIHEQTQGNRETPGAMYFVHDFDLRGRMYCEGYHINYMGNPYRKAMIEFAEPRYIEVPSEYRL